MDEQGAVAVVGMACRFAGCDNLDEFWRVLVNGENHVVEIPPERWSVDAFYAPNYEEPGKTWAKWAGLVDRPYEFDNVVFGINEKEATVMDPQQRMALEMSYKALENAGVPAEKIKGSNTAVYMCQMNEDYARHLGTDFNFWRSYEFTGSNAAILSNRISYTFDLRGPSVTVDTACSGAMVSIHMGTHSIMSGESDMAICGGSNFIHGPTTFIALTKSRMASPTGNCKAFSDNPDGYTKGEGCGVVILKRLDKAIADKNRIWGILKTSISSDGRAETPITSPSREQLRSLITNVCQKSKIHPADVQYVECHGTGTASGDPCEAWGVGMTVGQAKRAQGREPVPIGSVKTNIGHPESSAGTAGLIKVLLMMYHGQLVPSLHSERLNPKIDFEGLNIRVSRDCRKIGYVDEDKKTRLMSVNSNGFGGTAVQAVVQMEEDQVRPVVPVPDEDIQQKLPVIFTAVNEEGLKASIQDTIKAIKDRKIKSLYQLSNTSSLCRTHHSLRYVSYAKTLDEASTALEQYLETGGKLGKKAQEKGNNVIFSFCGMGSHWIKMGLQMYQEDSSFKDAVDKIQNQLNTYDVKVNILACFKGECDLTDPLYGQPAIFSVQVGLFETLKARGIEPNIILGHSVGEVAASYASGCVSFESAVKIIYERGRLLQKTQGGGMLVIGKLKVTHVQEVIQKEGLDVDLAASNSPTSCTLSGEVKYLEIIKKIILEKFGEGVFIRMLDVKVAYHSKFMEPILEELKKCLTGLESQRQDEKVVPIISTVTGKESCSEELCSPSYWNDNVRRGVNYAEALQKTLVHQKNNVIIEIGPKPVLRSYIKEIAADEKYILLSSMMENTSSDQINQVVAACFQTGIPVNWRKFYSTDCPVGDFPKYIFQKRYMFGEPEVSIAWRTGKCSQVEILSKKNTNIHPFVSQNKMSESKSDGKQFTAKFTPKTTPFIFEHKLKDQILAPGAVYSELGLASVSAQLKEPLVPGVDKITLSLKFNRALTINDEQQERETNITLFDLESESAEYKFQFDVTTDEVLHASGMIDINTKDMSSKLQSFNLHSIKKQAPTKLGIDQLYEKLERMGFTYGKSLKWAFYGWTGEKDKLLRVEAPTTAVLEHTLLHPVWVDTLFQMFALVDTKSNQQMIPTGISRIEILQNQERIRWAYIQVQSLDEEKMVLNGFLLDDQGMIVVKCLGMQVSQISAEPLVRPEEVMVKMNWKLVENEIEAKHNSTDPNNGLILFSVNDQSSFTNEVKRWNVPLFSLEKSNNVVTDIHAGNLMSHLPADLSKYGTLIYSWSQESNLKDEMDGTTVTNEVNETCILLLEVLKMIPESLKVYVLVNGVYNLMNQEKMCSKEGLQGCLGMAVVGMMRTVTWEATQRHLKVIDIDVSKTQNNKILKNMVSKPNDSSMEFAVRGGSLLSCHFEPVSDTLKVRQIQVEAETELQVNKHIDANNSPVIKIHQQKTSSTEIPTYGNHIKLQIQKVYLSPEKPVQALKHDTKESKSSQLMCYDSLAVDRNQKMYAVFQQLPVSTSKHDVPLTSCIPSSVFPTDVPCLSFWIRAWHIVMAVKPKSKWMVKATSNHNPLAEALKCICELYTSTKSCDVKHAKNIFIVTDNDDMNLLHDLENSCIANVCVVTENEDISRTIQLSNGKLFNKFEGYQIKSADAIFAIPIPNLIRKFRVWLESQNTKKIQELLVMFSSSIYAKSVKVSHIDDLDTNMNIEEHTILSLEVRSMKPIEAELTKDTIFRKNSSYLVFGGSKGLGWVLVQHMAKNGAGRIGIVSRSGITDEQRIILNDLQEEFKCHFIEMTADVTNVTQIERVFAEFDVVSPSLNLKGVFFGAVILQDCLMANMTSSIFKNVLAPKVAGAWNLYKVCSQYELDYLLFHSSIISMFGNRGQTNYAAGNAFLDAIAQYSRIFTGVGQAVCWGALKLGILEKNEVAQRQLSARGMNTLKKEEIIQCFEHALVYNPCVVGYSKFNFPRLVKELWTLQPAGQNLYRWVTVNKGHYLKKPTKNAAETVADRSGSALSYLRKQIQDLTMMEDDEILSDMSPDALGVDSGQLTVLYSELVKYFGTVGPLKVIDLPTKSLNEIAKFLPGGNSACDQNKVVTENKHEKESSSNITIESKTVTSNLKPEKKLDNRENSKKEAQGGSTDYEESVNSKKNLKSTLTVKDMKMGKYFIAGGHRTKCLKLSGSRHLPILEIKSRGIDTRKVPVRDISTIMLRTTPGDGNVMKMLCNNNGLSHNVTVHSDDAELLSVWKEAIMCVKQGAAQGGNVTFDEQKPCVIM